MQNAESLLLVLCGVFVAACSPAPTTHQPISRRHTCIGDSGQRSTVMVPQQLCERSDDAGVSGMAPVGNVATRRDDGDGQLTIAGCTLCAHLAVTTAAAPRSSI